jgi:hypothetical protein
MCLCCILHCDGSCNLQPGRVVKNGKSCYVGHCNTSAQCTANLSIYEKQQALIEFNKRCADHTKSEDEVASEDDKVFLQNIGDNVIHWYVYCDLCGMSMTTLHGNYFYHGFEDLDYCISCFDKIAEHRDKYEKWSSRHIDPYGESVEIISYMEALERYGHLE